MARFFFHTADGESVWDEDGVELSGLDEARTEAAKTLGRMLWDDPKHLWREHGMSVEVTDGRETLFKMQIVITDQGDTKGRA